jgi:alcohol dehydrogenase
MRLVKDNLLKVYLDGSNILARSEMMSAAMMGAVAFQKGLGVIHALSHPIGGLYNTHHGMTNAVLMPFVLKFNATEITEKIKKLALYLEITNEFEGFVKFVEELNKELNVPINLTALGVPIDGIDNIIDGAMKDPSRLGNPKELTADNLRVLLNSVF